MKYSGIDLHLNNSVVTITDEEDRVMAEKRLPNDLTKILGFLMPWREELAGVVVESTFNLCGFNSPHLGAKAVRRTAAFALGFGVDTSQLCCEVVHCRSQAILRAQESEDEHGGSHQGVGAQACPEPAEGLARACYHMLKENKPFLMKRAVSHEF